MNSPDIVASALVNFSTIGFMVLLGTATFIPMICELTILRKNTDKSVELLRHYPYRVISRLGGTWSMIFLMISSLSFIITGLLSLAYLLFKNEIFLNSALYLSVLVEATLCLYVVAILVWALPYQKKEIEQIREYGSARYEETDIKK